MHRGAKFHCGVWSDIYEARNIGNTHHEMRARFGESSGSNRCQLAPAET